MKKIFLFLTLTVAVTFSFMPKYSRGNELADNVVWGTVTGIAFLINASAIRHALENSHVDSEICPIDSKISKLKSQLKIVKEYQQRLELTVKDTRNLQRMIINE